MAVDDVECFLSSLSVELFEFRLVVTADKTFYSFTSAPVLQPFKKKKKQKEHSKKGNQNNQSGIFEENLLTAV